MECSSLPLYQSALDEEEGWEKKSLSDLSIGDEFYCYGDHHSNYDYPKWIQCIKEEDGSAWEIGDISFLIDPRAEVFVPPKDDKMVDPPHDEDVNLRPDSCSCKDEPEMVYSFYNEPIADVEPGFRRLRITLCGSTRFKKAWMEWNARLTLQGHVVYSVAMWSHDVRIEPTDEQKHLLDKVHLGKIDNSDEIFVLDVNGYIGNSTRGEIDYAKSQNKKVRYLSEEFPEWTEDDCIFAQMDEYESSENESPEDSVDNLGAELAEKCSKSNKEPSPTDGKDWRSKVFDTKLKPILEENRRQRLKGRRGLP